MYNIKYKVNFTNISNILYRFIKFDYFILQSDSIKGITVSDTMLKRSFIYKFV